MIVIIIINLLIVAQIETASAAETTKTSRHPDQTRVNQKSPIKQDGVGASVATDGALVFSTPDVNASILTQLPQNQRVRVSSAAISRGEERFRRIRIGNKIGYIVELDLRFEGADAVSTSDSDGIGNAKKDPSSKAAHDDQKKKRDRKKRIDAMKPKVKDPMAFTRYIGILVGNSEYKEAISNVGSSTSLLVYGLKITGPDVLISGPIIDFNIALHYGAPSYYGSLSSTRPTGFILFTDMLFLLPFVQKTDSMFYLGAGPLLVYSSFGVVNAGRAMDLTAVDFGASFMLGAGVRIERAALRLEAKYLLEKQSYKSLQAAVQLEF